jgi:hypothetical protein
MTKEKIACLQIQKALHLFFVSQLGLRREIETKRQRLTLVFPFNLLNDVEKRTK